MEAFKRRSDVAAGQLRRWYDKVKVPRPDRGRTFVVLGHHLRDGHDAGDLAWDFLQGDTVDWDYDITIWQDSEVIDG